MYNPEHFKQTDNERALDLVEAHPFGMLITAPDGMPFANHVPFLLDRSGAKPRLRGHLARANPQWRHFEPGREVLAVFQGPHAYVTPSLYSSPGVPTWNYAVVHLRGTPRLVEDEAGLDSLLQAMTHAHEAKLPNPWLPVMDAERKARLYGMIVGFEIEVTDIQAKFKLSQNRPEEDRARVADALAASGEACAGVTRLMRDIS